MGRRKTPRPHDALATLHGGGAASFEDAMLLVMQGTVQDEEVYTALGTEVPPQFTAGAVAATRCLLEYLRELRALRARLAARWGRSDDADVRLVGEALACGDYTILAQ